MLIRNTKSLKGISLVYAAAVCAGYHVLKISHDPNHQNNGLWIDLGGNEYVRVEDFGEAPNIPELSNYSMRKYQGFWEAATIRDDGENWLRSVGSTEIEAKLRLYIKLRKSRKIYVPEFIGWFEGPHKQ